MLMILKQKDVRETQVIFKNVHFITIFSTPFAKKKAGTPATWAVNFTIWEEYIMDIVTMHLVSQDCESTEENTVIFYTFSLCGHIGPIQGPELLTLGPWLSQFRQGGSMTS